MSLTNDQLLTRIQSIESVLSDAQNALNNVATKRELKNLLALLNTQITSLSTEIAEIETAGIGPGLATHIAASDPHPVYLLLTGIRSMAGNLNMGGYAITSVGNVDGRDVSVDGATLDTHISTHAQYYNDVASPIVASGQKLTLNVEPSEFSIINGKLTLGTVGITDHGELDGLADNDHTQYVNAVSAVPLTLAGQSIAFNYDNSDFLTSGNNLRIVNKTVAHAALTGIGADDHHDQASVSGAPLTILGQQITFNYDTYDFVVSGDNLKINDTGIRHGYLEGLTNDDHTQYLLTNGTRELTDDWDAGDWEIHANNLDGKNEGVLSSPVITDAGGLKLNVSSAEVLIRATDDWEGHLFRYTVPATSTLSVTNNATNWIVINYNSGSPIYAALTSNVTINNSTIIPVARVYMSGGVLKYTVDYGSVGRSAAIRNFDRVMRIRGTGGIERESGFALSETATRIINIESGVIWFGVDRIELDAIVQGVGGAESELWYHSGGNWTESDITAYSNTQYDDGTNLATLSANRYAVNWIFRNVVTDEIDVVLGRGNYTAAQATASTIPALPPSITGFYVLCGRIIVKKGIDTAYLIESVTTSAFQASAVTDHADLSGLMENDHTQYYNSIAAPIVASGQKLTLNIDPTDFQITDGALTLPDDIKDHGHLTGLADDDHTQYLKTDGTRLLTGNLQMNGYDIYDIDDILVDSATTDTVPNASRFDLGQDAWTQATGANRNIGTSVLKVGIPAQYLTMVSNLAGNLAVILDVCGVTYVFWSPTNFILGIDDTVGQKAVTATNIANAINATATLNTFITATASTIYVYLQPTALCWASMVTIYPNSNAVSATIGTSGRIRLGITCTAPNPSTYGSSLNGFDLINSNGGLGIAPIGSATPNATVYMGTIYAGGGTSTLQNTLLRGGGASPSAAFSFYGGHSAAGNNNLRIYAACNAAGEENVVLGTSVTDASGGNLSTLLALATDVDGTAAYKFRFYGTGEQEFAGTNRISFGLTPTTDVAPTAVIHKATDCYSQATGANRNAANLVLAPGIATQFYTIVSNLAGAVTVTTTVNGTAVALASTTNFALGSSDLAAQLAVTATNLAAAINGNATLTAQLVATASTTFVYLAPKASCYQLSIATTLAGAISTTAGTPGQLIVSPSSATVPTIASSLTPTTGIGFNVYNKYVSILVDGVHNLALGGTTTNAYVTAIGAGNLILNGGSSLQLQLGGARAFSAVPSAAAGGQIQFGGGSTGTTNYSKFGSASDGTIAATNSAGTVTAALFQSIPVEFTAEGSASPNILTSGESRKLLANRNVSAENYHALPTCATGCEYEFYCQDSDGIRVVPGTDDVIRIASAITSSGSAGYIRSVTPGSKVKLVGLDNDQWVALDIAGSWTLV